MPTTGETPNTSLVNSTTFLGAIAFFLGAYLLLPPNRRPEGSITPNG